MSRVPKKPDFVTISIYAVLAVFVIYFSAALGACFDLALDENGKADFDKLGNSLESTLMDTDLVFEKIGEGGKAIQFPIFTAFGIGLYVLTKITGKKKFHRKGEEHGSARWANKKEINSLLDKPPKQKISLANLFKPRPKKPPKPKKGEFVLDNNIILTNDVKMSLNTRQTRKNLNVMVIGGSGSGKSRFYVKPNLMQANTSYVCTDPKGELLRSTGKMLESYGYKIKVFNLIDMAHSHNYNPFNYIYDVDGNYSTTAVIKMVNVLMKNTQKEGGGGGDQFWDDSTKALLAALCFYLVECESKEMQNFSEVMKLLKKAEVKEGKDEFQSDLDLIFDALEHPEKYRTNEAEKNEQLKSLNLIDLAKNAKAPSQYMCLKYYKDYFMWNNKYARTMFIKDMPSSLKDDMLTEIANTNLDVMITVNIAPVDPYKALKIVNHQLTSMRANKLQAEKKALRSGYTTDVINEDLKHSLIEAEELLDDLRSKNQKMFLNNIIIMVTADDIDELDNSTEAIEAVIRKQLCSVSTLKFQQEKGLQSVLPLGNCTLKIRRTLTTESTAVFLPFAAKEISQKNGMYYGLNAISNNMIIFNRLMLKNPNGFILGSPGSGKSFSAKREMLNVFLATDDDIIIIDPEREYTDLVAALNGETINVSPASTNYINPLDMSQDYSDEQSPLVMKSDFILSFCECLVGKQGLTAKEKAIIDRCLTNIYVEYLQNFDHDKIPTLMDFYENIKAQPEDEAQGLALSIELYIKGNLNVFAHKTNVNTSNRVVSYDIKDLGKQLKTIGMLIVLDYVWNRITVNRARGKRTWIYLDEIYLLFANEQSANFLYELYKRARKWGGVPTGITQNVEDLLKSETARSMLSNTDFVLMLNQATSDRIQLARLLNISDNLLTHVTSSESGSGLICCGGSIIPFVDKFPHNELYDLMTTKLEEVSDDSGGAADENSDES